MRVAMVHNRYRERGGEDSVFEAELESLRSRGVEVAAYEVHNDEVAGLAPASLALKAVWNRASYRSLASWLDSVRPDVVHFHNTFPLVSPAGYYAAGATGAAVVQTLHNYRLVCPSALLLRNGAPCEACVGRMVAWPGVVHACYRGSRAASAVVASMLLVHRSLGTYERAVTRFVALTEFAKGRFVAGGLDPERITVKGNFLSSDPGVGDGSGGYALFVGRLSPEKGVQDLLDAWREAPSALPLRIIGDGPCAAEVRTAAASLPGVTWLGARPRAEVVQAMKQATVLVFPSRWYEGMPMTIIEAYGTGTPVIGTRLGSTTEMIDHGRSGYLVPPGDRGALIDAVRWFADDPIRARGLRAGARKAYLDRFTADQNFVALVRIYEQAIAERRQSSNG
jgi:glycosyltransferase involved in cell wall biosynthesis